MTDPNKIVKYYHPSDPDEVAKAPLKTFRSVWGPKGFTLVEGQVEDEDAGDPAVAVAPAKKATPVPAEVKE